ncbi:YkgJ family cysteine cluster protein [Hydrogenophaga sp. 2FB]|uniref:YkgJ family cysteine cluster protein n=1 Tax=Hydrogenophaga sp. 2FB TaxID=2502187 RepID=UPI0010F8940B|nr:YkgJ family cysteine cluster protein [Hydrogenophaga sp. 2FB]
MNPADIEQALRTLTGGVEIHGDPKFSDEINERLLTAGETAQANAGRADPATSLHVRRLLSVAIKAPTNAKKVAWLHKAADTHAAAIGPHAACHDGCSHCCHVPVAISRLEALAMGRAIGRSIIEPEYHEPLAFRGYEAPCPFLVDNRCSVYNARPAVCRTHFNLDADDLLCRLTPGQDVPVPYSDTRLFVFAATEMEPNPGNWADIRQWFGSPARAESV